MRMCYIYLKDYHLAEDITQETFFQVYDNYESFQQQSSIKTWIIRIAINLCKNQMRTKWFSVKRQEEFPVLSYTEDYDGVIDREQLLTAIGNLKPKYKEVVLLFYYQELLAKEIYVEIFTSEQGYTVNVIKSTTTSDTPQIQMVFVANGIRYTLQGRVPVDEMKDIVNSMK